MDKKLLWTVADETGISLSAEQLDMFELYSFELIEWNQKSNLTAIEDQGQIIIKHFYDSLLGMKVSAWSGSGSLLDLGTGAGFPGVPLLIVNPKIQLTLVDSLQKRIAFLEHLVRSLQLPTVKMIHSRAEELGQNRLYREKYDIVVSRAVAKLPVLLEYCLPMTKIGGIFMAYKGPEGSAELRASEKAMEILGGEMLESKNFDLPCNGGRRCIIVIEKNKSTTKEYPRRAGMPTKKPL